MQESRDQLIEVVGVRMQRCPSPFLIVEYSVDHGLQSILSPGTVGLEPGEQAPHPLLLTAPRANRSDPCMTAPLLIPAASASIPPSMSRDLPLLSRLAHSYIPTAAERAARPRPPRPSTTWYYKYSAVHPREGPDAPPSTHADRAPAPALFKMCGADQHIIFLRV